MAEESGEVMTDADFEKALDALREQEPNGEVGELLKMMNENRMISWEEAEQILGGSSYNEPVKSSLPEQTRPTEPDNDTDVDVSIQKLLENDPKLKEINLNNMKRTPIPQVKRLISAIRDNTYLEKLALANMGLYDTNVEPLIDVVENNSTLKSINLETNYLSGDFFAKLFQAALKNQTLEEVKAVNQGVTFSTTSEKAIIDAIFANKGIIKVSINLRLPEGRHKLENAMLRNGEIKRILRRQAAQAAKTAGEANKKTEQEQADKKKDEVTKDSPKKTAAAKTAAAKTAAAKDGAKAAAKTPAATPAKAAAAAPAPAKATAATPAKAAAGTPAKAEGAALPKAETTSSAKAAAKAPAKAPAKAAAKPTTETPVEAAKAAEADKTKKAPAKPAPKSAAKSTTASTKAATKAVATKAAADGSPSEAAAARASTTKPAATKKSTDATPAASSAKEPDTSVDKPASKAAPAVPPKKKTVTKKTTAKPVAAGNSEAEATTKSPTSSKVAPKKTTIAAKKSDEPMAVYPLKKTQKE